MATAELKPVSELFGMNFFVPVYQRGFRWTKVQIEETLEDLYEFSVARDKKNDNEYYCLQPVIVRKREDDSWELVDGQQRLTALWLIQALYYCSNKEELMALGIPRKSYSLTYEGKDIFTSVFKKIEEYVDDDQNTSVFKLPQVLGPEKEKSVDSLNLIKNLELITKFTIKDNAGNVKVTPTTVLKEISNSFEYIKVIWYVLEDDTQAKGTDDPIQTFSNINANKIELTNAELIKAILLHSAGEDRINSIAEQWEAIEKGLHDDRLWNFIVNEKHGRKYDTRIDYLFEIWCEINDIIVVPYEQDRHAVFHVINELLRHETSGNKAVDIWNGIKSINEIIHDWYEDYFWYHTIGTIIAVNMNNNRCSDAELVKGLFKEYKNRDKESFNQYLIHRLMEIYYASKNVPVTKGSLQAEFEKDLNENVNYSSDRAKNVLLIYNIAILINANNSYERFPFDLYKGDTWDLEHINPQTPKSASEEEKKAWLESYQKMIATAGSKFSNKKEIDTLLTEIASCVSSADLLGFDSVAEKIQQTLKISDNDSVGNLVLLDSATNRGYKNDCFSEKRKTIIEVERKIVKDDSKAMAEKYIPIGTKWVFLKGFEKSDQLIVWTEDDMGEYINDIAFNVCKLFGGVTDGRK